MNGAKQALLALLAAESALAHCSELTAQQQDSGSEQAEALARVREVLAEQFKASPYRRLADGGIEMRMPVFGKATILRPAPAAHDALQAADSAAQTAAEQPAQGAAVMVMETCGDCDPCIGGRPDQCAVGGYPVLRETLVANTTDDEAEYLLNLCRANPMMGNKEIITEMRKVFDAPPAPAVPDSAALRDKLTAISDAIWDGDDRAALAIIDTMLAAAPEVPRG